MVDLCERVLSKDEALKPLFSKSDVRSMKVSSGREVFYIFKPAAGKSLEQPGEVRVWEHGLGEDMTRLEALAREALNDGKSVLLFDKQLHGMNLERLMKQEDPTLPTTGISLRDNVDDFLEVMQAHKIKTVRLAGHSLGGGEVYRMAATIHERKIPIKVKSVVMMMPYVQRLDRFLLQHIFSPEFSLEKTADLMESAGMPSVYVDMLIEPFMAFASALLSQPREMRDRLVRYSASQQLKDAMLDQFIVRHMEQAYRKFFLFLERSGQGIASGQQLKLTNKQKKLIDLKVQAAINVTIAVREDDLLDLSLELPEVGAPVIVMGASKDPIVIEGQLRRFASRMDEAGIRNRFLMFNGNGADHHTAQHGAKQVYAEILRLEKELDNEAAQNRRAARAN